jgi:peroxiredoxin
MSEVPANPSTKKKRNLGTAFFIIGLFLIGAVVIFYLSDLQGKALDASQYILQPATVSYEVPQLNLIALDEAPVSLADYRGKVVLVNNWATWCPPCQTEMPELQKYYQKHSNQGFVVVAIESGEPASTVAEFARTYELSFPIWLDPRGIAIDAFKNWDLPSSYIIDREGIVRLTWTGPVNVTTLEKYVTPLLEK